MKIAVTGTAGRIGRAIHFALCQEHEVVGIDRAVSSEPSSSLKLRPTEI